MRDNNVKKLVGIALFIAIIAVLQFLGAFIRFGPFSISLVLVPIVVGAAIYGRVSGALLGLFFGVMVFITGDAAAFFTINPAGTVVTVLLKGLLAGLCAGIVYHALENKNKYLAVILAAIVCPVVNTGIFLIGCRLFFFGTINEWAANAGFADAGTYMIVGLVGLNFIVEMAVNVVLSPVILKLIEVGKKQFAK